MKQIPIIVAVVGMAALAALKYSGRSKPSGKRFIAMRNDMMKRMLQTMPEDSPPRLVASVLPVLQKQNEQILALLEDQADLLRASSAIKASPRVKAG